MLNQWKQYINDIEFKILIDFIEKTREGIKIKKFICLNGNKDVTEKIISDITDIIIKDNLNYCEYPPYKSVSLKDFYKRFPEEKDTDADEESKNEDILLDCDEDNEEYSNYYEYEFYINKKLLTLNKNILPKSIGFIKSVLGNDLMLYYNCKNPIGERFYTIIPNCNIIIETDNIKPILNDRSIFIRSLIINIDC